MFLLMLTFNSYLVWDLLPIDNALGCFFSLFTHWPLDLNIWQLLQLSDTYCHPESVNFLWIWHSDLILDLLPSLAPLSCCRAENICNKLFFNPCKVRILTKISKKNRFTLYDYIEVLFSLLAMTPWPEFRIYWPQEYSSWA